MMARRVLDRPIPMPVLERTARILRVLAHPHRLLRAARKLPVVIDAIEVMAATIRQQLLNKLLTALCILRHRRGLACRHRLADSQLFLREKAE